MKKAIVAATLAVVAAATWWFVRDSALVEVAGPARAAEAAMPDARASDGVELESLGSSSARDSVPLAPGVRDRRTGELLIHVRWSDGSPAVGMELRLEPRGAQDAGVRSPWLASNARGEVALADLAPGTYAITCDRRVEAQAAVVAGELTRVSLELPAGVTVRGRVVDKHGGAPSGAEVWLGFAQRVGCGRYVAQAAADGSFELRDVPPSFLVAARARDFAACAPQKIAVAPGETLEIELVLVDRSATLRGRVQAAAGQPVPGAAVQIGAETDSRLYGRAELWSPPPIVVETDEHGLFESPWVALQPQFVVIQAARFSPWSGSVEPTDGRFDELSIELGPGAVLTGTVRDEGGEPIEAATIRTRRLGFLDPTSWRSVSTAANGTYRVADLAAGEFVATAEASGFPPVSTEFRPEPGEARTWDPVLARGETIHGRLIDESGAPLADFPMRAESVQGRSRLGPAVTDDDGRFLFEECERRAYSLLVYEPGAPDFYIYAVPEVLPSQDELAIVLPAASRVGARVVGRLEWADGTPLPPTRVWVLRRPFDRGPTYSSDETGAFSVGPLPADAYRLRALLEGRPQRELGTHELRAGELLDLGTISVQEASHFQLTLLGADYRPASDAVVRAIDAQGELRAGGSCRDGSFASGGLDPGVYRVQVWGADFPFMDREAELVPGEHAHWTWNAPSSVRRRIVFVKPREDCDLELNISFRGPDGVVFWTDEGGNWPGTTVAEFERAFERGTYRIEASGSGFKGSGTLEVRLDDEPGGAFEVLMEPEDGH